MLIHLFFIVQLLDVITTYLGLNYFDAIERNQSAVAGFNEYGFFVWSLIKLVSATGVFLVLYLMKEKLWNNQTEKRLYSRFYNVAGSSMVLVMLAVVVSNIMVMA